LYKELQENTSHVSKNGSEVCRRQPQYIIRPIKIKYWRCRVLTILFQTRLALLGIALNRSSKPDPEGGYKINMMPQLETTLSCCDTGDTWTLTLSGSIDQRSFNRLGIAASETVLEQLSLARAKKLIIDLTAVEQLGSPGLQFLLLLKKQLANQRTQISLRSVQPHFKRILQIMQLDRLFEVEGA
jgi:anti-anti-sigma factor